MKTPLLETERLFLRPATLADAPAMQKYFNNWNIIKNLSTVVPWPYPDDGAETFLRDMALPKAEKGEIHIWVITCKENGEEAIGVIEYRFSDEEKTGNRGFWLAEPFWGRGYMTEAVAAVQDFLFFDIGIEKMKVTNASSNKGSARVKEKTGAKYLGSIDCEHHEGGRAADLWEITKEGWAEFRNK